MLKLLLSLQLFLFLSVNSYAQISSNYTVFFDVSSSNIDNKQLQGLVAYLDTIPKARIFSISIVGFTDDTGTTGINKKLSNDRAAAILMIMRSTSFPMERTLEISGKGIIHLDETSKKSAEEQRRLNRRVEIIIELDHFSNEAILFENPPQVGDFIILPSVHFKGGSHKLQPESFRTLSYLLFYLREHEKFEITLLGHVCCLQINKDAMDQDTGIRNLSAARAKVIYDFLIENGIASSRLKSFGFKADFPLGEGDRKDRRVEIYVSQI